jgi:tyrosine-protein phosphatase SIW14
MQSKPAIANIRNFHNVQDWLMRGGQPTPAQLGQLAAAGVRTVISLRTGPKATQAELRLVEELGMKFIHIPIYYLCLPDEATLETFLQALDDAGNQPLFIHCFHGVDRTGFLVAIYRMSREGWTFAEAYEEMKRCGFHSFRLPHFKWMLLRYANKLGATDRAGNNQGRISVKRS